MTTWTPSNEAVERAARAMAERKGYDIVRLKAGHYENDAQTWDDYIDDATTALIAGHEDAAVLEGWMLVPVEPTVEMLRDGANQCLNFYSEKGPYPRSRAVYRAMLDAAPPAPETKK